MGQFLTPSWVSLESGGFLSILIPSFSDSVAMLLLFSALTDTILLLLLFLGKVKGNNEEECLVLQVVTVVVVYIKHWLGLGIRLPTHAMSLTDFHYSFVVLLLYCTYINEKSLIFPFYFLFFLKKKRKKKLDA